MTGEEHKWIETNNSVCALLRQAHDVLAMSSFPPKRKWIGLMVEDFYGQSDLQILAMKYAEAKLKERNT